MFVDKGKDIMKKQALRVSALLIAQVFLFAVCAFAVFDIGQVKIASSAGKVTETYRAPESSAAKKYIIHIQDLHCNYEAQKNLAAILEDLYNTYKIDTILVEGGTGDVSLAFLRKEGPKDVRVKVAEKYLRKGLISGEEYLDIVSDYPLILRGIEDEDLYQKNIDAFFSVEDAKDKALDYITALRGIANSLKPYIYDKELLEFDSKSTSYHQDRMKMVDFISYLCNVAKLKNVSIKPYANIEKIVELKNVESRIDFRKADFGRTQLVEELSKKLSKGDIEYLKKKAMQFREGKITQVDFYVYLQNLAGAQNINLKQYPDLLNYISYLSGSKLVSAKALFNEIALLEEQLKQKLAVKDDQKTLDAISTNIRLLVDLINLKLTPDEYERYLKIKQTIDVAAWQEFLAKEAAQYNLAGVTPKGIEALTDNLAKFEAFYVVAVKRDDALINNAIDAMTKLGKDKAVLITGGFHSGKMTQKLKDSGFSYVVVAPKAASSPEQEKLYLEVMRYKESHKLK